MKPEDLYLAIAFLKQCNYACGYCHPFGESKITHGQNMSQDELAQVIDSAYAAGFRVFRFTGGECTILPWFADVLHATVSKGPDIRVNVCTNGSMLDKHMAVYEQYKQQVTLRVSLDSMSEAKRQYGIDKVLTPQLNQNLKELSMRGIRTRFNVVVTTANVEEIEDIIVLGENLGFDVKLLDLYVQDEYIATHGKNGKQQLLSPLDYWRGQFVDLTTLVPKLRVLSSREIAHYNKDGGMGIPMYAFQIGKITVILKDSTQGAYHSESKCMNGCPFFGTVCQEGVYTPHVSSNMTLHINGCHHPGYRWELRDQPFDRQVQMFEEILSCFADLHLVKSPPRTIRLMSNRRAIVLQ